MSNQAITPFQASEYFRKAAPDAARIGTRGYILRVLLDMARLKGAECGTCFPSVSYLAKLVGRSVRHIRRVLRELEDMGELERIANHREDGGQSSNTYRLRGLLAWVKNVRGASDKRVRHNSYGKNLNPARGGFMKSGKTKPASLRPTLSVPNERRGDGEVAKPLGLTDAQISEAKRLCDPLQWEQLKLTASIEDHAEGAKIEYGAAKRWRASAIMRGVTLR